MTPGISLWGAAALRRTQSLPDFHATERKTQNYISAEMHRGIRSRDATQILAELQKLPRNKVAEIADRLNLAHHALECTSPGADRLMKYLATKGCNLHPPLLNGQTLIERALNRPNLFDIILSKGLFHPDANQIYNQPNANGDTVIHLMASSPIALKIGCPYPYRDMMEHVIRAGGNYRQPNKQMSTPVNVADRTNNDIFLDLVEKHLKYTIGRTYDFQHELLTGFKTTTPDFVDTADCDPLPPNKGQPPSYNEAAALRNPHTFPAPPYTPHERPDNTFARLSMNRGEPRF